MAAIARTVRITENQLWTLLAAALVAVVVVVGGLPALSHDSHATATPTGLVPLNQGGAIEPSAPGAATVAGDVGPGTAGGLVVSNFVVAPAVPSVNNAELLPPPGVAGPTPVRLVAAGWASSSPTTGAVSDPSVPAASLPVAARGGAIEKVSFLRFSGTPRTLRFVLAQGDALTQQNPTAATLEACAITSAQWTGKDGGALADAPAFDCTRASPVTTSPDGSWAVDISTLGRAAVDNGIALVPIVSGVATFQVVFARP